MWGSLSALLQHSGLGASASNLHVDVCHGRCEYEMLFARGCRKGWQADALRPCSCDGVTGPAGELCHDAAPQCTGHPGSEDTMHIMYH